ncbi:MAG: homocysteine S-methyltransferase family protein [Pseudomonadota bacterium]
MYDHLAEKLETGKTILIDGGTGTDLEKRGAQMVGAAWCAFATETAPDILASVHDDYIAVGAEVIAMNTYATTLPMIQAAGHDRDKWEKLTAQSYDIARASANRAPHPVAVAASFSVMRPVIAGTDQRDPTYTISEEDERALLIDQAALLKDLGCDLIIMEMMRDTHRSVWATEIAVETGLPVWTGICCRANEDGDVRGYNNPDIPFGDIAPSLLNAGGVAAGIMHSDINVTQPALDILRETWDGPLMAYPESGHFKMPEWQFSDLTPDEFAELAIGWVNNGVQIIGGCCGVSVDHIAALAKALEA